MKEVKEGNLLDMASRAISSQGRAAGGVGGGMHPVARELVDKEAREEDSMSRGEGQATGCARPLRAPGCFRKWVHPGCRLQARRQRTRRRKRKVLESKDDRKRGKQEVPKQEKSLKERKEYTLLVK